MRTTTLIGAGALAAAAVLVGPAAALASTSSTLYVAPNGHDSSPCSRTAPCRTIGHTIHTAHAGNTVLVAPGTYREHVTVGKRLALRAQGPGTLIDATGALNGIGLGVDFSDPNTRVGNASGSTVNGFTIKNATQEGIVALGSNFDIANNVIAHNDLGATSAHPAGECAGEGQVPGDCGEGLHLAGVTHSIIEGNYVTGNQGGILVSDEFGPTAFNLIAHNTVVNNVPDCGITLPGHNPAAINSSGVRQPSMGGVYRNRIIDNTVNANGAAGIGFFAGGPGTGSYDNTAEGNSISSNGIPGVAIHTHALHSDTNGNRILGNFFSRNGLGEGGSAPVGDPGTPVNTTTNIDVVADPGATPISGTVIQHNRITNARVGIWLVTGGGSTTLGGNTFQNVQTPVRHS
ncbi:MAG TPA: right-handed parallel beta-helix repeat-containing protein [Frankiaceae bacterium]|nr:right-handed parallel beta-helix repeat-containing protein [Frankiaceae bacterium]